MERAIGTTFKVGNDELIVKEVDQPSCIGERGVRCYFYKTCLKKLPNLKVVGHCISMFRKDRKNVIFIKI